jgi:hypothetical protein
MSANVRGETTPLHSTKPPPPAPGDHIIVWIDNARARIEKARTLVDLAAAWNALTPEIQSHVVEDKDRRKAELAAAKPAAWRPL